MKYVLKTGHLRRTEQVVQPNPSFFKDGFLILNHIKFQYKYNIMMCKIFFGSDVQYAVNSQKFKKVFMGKVFK